MTAPKWLDPKITVGNLLTLIGLISALVGGFINLKLDIAASASAVQVGQIDTRVSVLENSSVTNRANRDKQIADIYSRIDRNDSTVNVKLDKLVDATTQLSTEVAGLAATIKAQPRSN